MSPAASAYATLGLEPGADAAAIEQAYKRLIKQFHPDRAGGDAARAAEINRAYRELRLAGRVRQPLDLEPWDEGGAGAARVRMAVAALGLAGAATIGAGAILFAGSRPAITAPLALAQAPADRPEAMDEPLAIDAIGEGVREAVRLSGSSDEVALASASRECHRKFRAEPTVAALDRCAAFDDAVAKLQDRDPLRDRGPFSELAVTGRKMSGATLLSTDVLAIDSRLDQIRLRVELALAPPPLPEVKPVED